MRKSESLRVVRNLRFLLWRKKVQAERWESTLGQWVNAGERSGAELLRGSEPTPSEIDLIADRFSLGDDELIFSDLLAESDTPILRENIGHLVVSLGHGGINTLAEILDVNRATIFAWRQGRQEPTATHRRELLRYFGLPLDLNLETEPLFLDERPIGEAATRHWLHARLDALDRTTLLALFPALQRLFVSP
jgi:transcriptional regulator with XRE-family HTH domain